MQRCSAARRIPGGRTVGDGRTRAAHRCEASMLAQSPLLFSSSSSRPRPPPPLPHPRSCRGGSTTPSVRPLVPRWRRHQPWRRGTSLGGRAAAVGASALTSTPNGAQPRAWRPTMVAVFSALSLPALIFRPASSLLPARSLCYLMNGGAHRSRSALFIRRNMSDTLHLVLRLKKFMIRRWFTRLGDAQRHFAICYHAIRFLRPGFLRAAPCPFAPPVPPLAMELSMATFALGRTQPWRDKPEGRTQTTSSSAS